MDQISKGASQEPFEIGVEEITFYYDEMVRSNLVELEVETPKGKIVLKRYQKEKDPRMLLRRKTDFAPAKAEEISSAKAPASNAPAITSPITGTFYRSASPQSPPLVKEGDTVNAGTTLCIVEAMKVMNEIKAENRCKIVKILAENAKPVTKGQALFYYEAV